MPEIIVKLGDNVVHKYYFDKDVISVGRARDNDIVIENLAVSRNHARIRRENTNFVLTDLNSANGTYVNGVRVTKTEVMNDDVVTIGKHYLHFINKEMNDEQIISDAFGAERTMIVEKVANATLAIVKGKQQGENFSVTKYETFIGRASDNDIRLHDWFVSKKHAVIVRQGQKFFIRDLGSWRGTKVNDKQVKDSELKGGDVLGFGTTELEFKFQSDEALLIEGRKPVEMIGEDVPMAAEEPVAAPGSTSPAAAHAGPDLSASFVQLITHPEQQRDGGSSSGGAPAAQAPVFADTPEEEFFLQSEGEDEAPAPNFGGGEDKQDVIFVDDDEKQPYSEAEAQDNLALDFSAGADSRALAGEQHPATPKPTLDHKRFEEAVNSLDDAPAPPAHHAAGGNHGPVIARQEEYDLPPNLPAGVDEKLIRMWLRAMSNKSKVVRKQAARELKKLTGITYEWE